MESNTPNEGAAMSAQRHRRRYTGHWRTIAFASVLLGGLLGILLFIFRNSIVPAVEVDTVQVVLLTIGTADESTVAVRDELLFQASGWLEPDPWVVKVPTLTDGIVESVFVTEGQSVTNGQLLARLDQRDAILELKEGEASVAAAQARLTDTQDRWQRIKALPDRDASPSERVSAESAFLEKSALLASAQSMRDAALLALERTEIRSPQSGVVMRRYVDPGSKRGRALDDPNSAVIVSLFDPLRLQVRVDVPIAEAGRLSVGQPTRISTAMLPGSSFTGRVSRIVGEADLQRNTLQAKVAVQNPDPKMRPDVLCRVEFRGFPDQAAGAEGSRAGSRHTLWIPEEAVADPSNPSQGIWIADPLTSRLSRRDVELGSARHNGYRRALKGLRANEIVVIPGENDLKPGVLVTAREREESP